MDKVSNDESWLKATATAKVMAPGQELRVRVRVRVRVMAPGQELHVRVHQLQVYERTPGGSRAMRLEKRRRVGG